MGGVLALSAILALSLTFASCANNSDTNDENPSPVLPANVGENPITKTIRLYSDSDKERYLEIRTDSTALYICEDKYEEVQTKYKYTYDTDAKRIYMKVEKTLFGDELMYVAGASEVDELLTYDETCSKINEWYTVKTIREGLKKFLYEDKEWLEERYPNCNSYEDFEAQFVKKEGFKTLDDYVKYYKRMYENAFKRIFGAQITYSYKIENGKLTLTEKFTSVKNLIGDSECEFDDNSSYGYIDCTWASINFREDDSRYSGDVNTDKKTISFESEDKKEKVNATYTEDIAAGTVTINFKGKEYVCEFEGEKYTQVE